MKKLRVLLIAGILDLVISIVFGVSSLVRLWGATNTSGQALFTLAIALFVLTVAGGVAAVRGKPWWLAYLASCALPFQAAFFSFLVRLVTVAPSILILIVISSLVGLISVAPSILIAISRKDWSKKRRTVMTLIVTPLVISFLSVTLYIIVLIMDWWNG